MTVKARLALLGSVACLAAVGTTSVTAAPASAPDLKCKVVKAKKKAGKKCVRSTPTRTFAPLASSTSGFEYPVCRPEVLAPGPHQGC
jgi:hypothetical protein